MALPWEVAAKPDIEDPQYKRVIWARYLAQEALHALAEGKVTIEVSRDGARELADLLDPNHGVPVSRTHGDTQRRGRRKGSK